MNLAKSSLIRALWTFGEAFLGMVASAKVFADVDWPYVLSACLFSAMVAFIKCLVTGLPESRVDGALIISEDGDGAETWRFEAYDSLENLADLAAGRFEIKKQASINLGANVNQKE